MSVRAVVFDVDGTLYHQPPLRAAMALELALVPALRLGPRGAGRLVSILRTFRHVRQQMRADDDGPQLLEDLQYSATAERIGVEPETVRQLVDEWMFRRPLRYLPMSRRAGVGAAFAWLQGQGMAIGVFSDYPTQAKLQALGLDAGVAVQICATDRDVNAFKPDPRGFLAACGRLGLPPDSVVYVGDRPEVDAAGAHAAGMLCLIVGRRRHNGPHPYVPLPSFDHFEAALRVAEGNR